MKSTTQFDILDHSPIGQFVLDRKFNILFWNKCLENWTGIKRDHLLGSSIFDHYPHLKEPKYFLRLENTLDGGPPTVFSSQLHKHIIPAQLPNDKLRIQYTVVTRIPCPKKSGQNNIIFSIQDVTSLSETIDNNKLTLKKLREEIQERKCVEEKLIQNENRLQEIANHDPLTNLPNRRLMTDRLNQAIVKAKRNSNRVAVLFLDLDRFKNINDTLGHDVGDLLLLEIAKRLRHCVREGDTVSRLGGDEFVIILEGISENHHVARVCEKILHKLSKAIKLKGYELVTNTSIGISMYPDDHENADDLLKCADTAMYRAKEHGGHNYQFFVPEMNKKAIELLLIESHLRKAIKNNELYPAYQPKFTLSTGRLIGAEALLRWESPRLGQISPLDFIPLAEDTGLIIPIGEWIMHSACVQNRKWQDKGRAPLKISVNISARQFRRADLVDTVKKILKDTRIPPQCLELELTETVVMKDAEATIEMLHTLNRLGVSLAIDDFGTGYSSLNYLKRFPIHALKIDQSFVRDITRDTNDAAIVYSTIALAHSMVLPVVAEGIETEQQLNFLLKHGCDQGQGFFLGKPSMAPDFERFLYQKVTTLQ